MAASTPPHSNAFALTAATLGAITAGFVVVTMCLPARIDPAQQSCTTQSCRWCNWVLSSGPADWTLVIIGALTAFAAVQTLNSLQKQVAANVDAATAASANAAAASDNAKAASSAAASAAIQVQVMRDALATTRRVDRAYVDLSHSPPGLVKFLPDTEPSIEICIKNHGRTPADILLVALNLVLGGKSMPLPPDPPYDTAQFTTLTAFLMPNETVRMWNNLDKVPTPIIDEINGGNVVLTIVGYVEYVDRFGQKHRNGYARRYIPKPIPTTSNNLVFVDQPGYNYDIEV
jgi:hypothetical protein